MRKRYLNRSKLGDSACGRAFLRVLEPAQRIFETATAILRSFRGILASALLLTLLVLTGSDFGEYVDRTLFYIPAYRLRLEALGGPTLDPRLRVVMVEDSSRRALGGVPTVSEWYEVARHLFGLGYKRVLLLDNPTLPQQVGKLGERDEHGSFFLGGVATQGRATRIATPAAEVPRHLLSNRAATGIPEGGDAILPHADALSIAHGIGHLNFSDDLKVQAALRLGDAVMPSFGLLAVPPEAWPQDLSRELYVDYLPPALLATVTVPASAFFAKDERVVKSELAANLVAKLRGGEVALLVPEGFSGSRFASSPVGRVLSYVSVASLANNALQNFYVVRPVDHGFVLWIWGAIVFVSLSLLGGKRGILALSGLSSSFLLICVVAYVRRGWFLPAMEAQIVTTVGVGLAAAAMALRSWQDRMRLHHELELGSAVQRFLLPATRTGRAGKFEYAIAFKPYGPMSGDWFQLHTGRAQDEDKMLLAFGDVVGKGASAALVTAVIGTAFRALRHDELRVDEVRLDNLVQRVNDLVFEMFVGSQNTTLSLARTSGNDLEVAAIASQSWLQHRRASGKIERVRTKADNPLGMRGEPRLCQSVVVPCEPGDFVFSYTDGILDGASGARFLIESLKARPIDFTLPLPDLVTALSARAEAVGAETVLGDDRTFVIIRRVA